MSVVILSSRNKTQYLGSENFLQFRKDRSDDLIPVITFSYVHLLTKWLYLTHIENTLNLASSWLSWAWGTFLFVGPFFRTKILKIEKLENPIRWGKRQQRWTGETRTRDRTRMLHPHGWRGRRLSHELYHIFSPPSLPHPYGSAPGSTSKATSTVLPIYPACFLSLSQQLFCHAAYPLRPWFSVSSNLEAGQSYK